MNVDSTPQIAASLMSEDGDASIGSNDEPTLATSAALSAVNDRRLAAIATLLSTELFTISPDPALCFVLAPASPTVGRHLANLIPDALPHYMAAPSEEDVSSNGSSTSGEDYEAYLHPENV